MRNADGDAKPHLSGLQVRFAVCLSARSRQAQASRSMNQSSNNRHQQSRPAAQQSKKKQARKPAENASSSSARHKISVSLPTHPCKRLHRTMCLPNDYRCNTLRLPIMSKARTRQKSYIAGENFGHHVASTHHQAQSGDHNKEKTSSSMNADSSGGCPSAEDIIKCIDGAVGRDRDHESECIKLRAKFRACMMERHGIH